MECVETAPAAVIELVPRKQVCQHFTEQWIEQLEKVFRHSCLEWSLHGYAEQLEGSYPLLMVSHPSLSGHVPWNPLVHTNQCRDLLIAFGLEVKLSVCHLQQVEIVGPSTLPRGQLGVSLGYWGDNQSYRTQGGLTKHLVFQSVLYLLRHES